MTSTRTPETAALLDNLATRRAFLVTTATDLTDDQARTRSTVSELTIASLLKHVTATEREWIRFVQDGARPEDDDIDWSNLDWSRPDDLPEAVRRFQQEWQVGPDVTLADLLEDYESAAADTGRVIDALPDLEVNHELPKAPWFEPGASWTARDVLLHLIGETAQHCGHADIIRESIDGRKTMG